MGGLRVSDGERLTQEAREGPRLGEVARGIDTAKLFPDYSGVIETALPDLSEVIAPRLSEIVESFAAMAEVSSQSAALRISESISKSLARAIPDMSNVLGPTTVERIVESLRAISVSRTFPDYSKVLSGLTFDAGSLFKGYAAAMPTAIRVADTFVTEAVLPVVAPDVDVSTGSAEDGYAAFLPRSATRRTSGSSTPLPPCSQSWCYRQATIASPP